MKKKSNMLIFALMLFITGCAQSPVGEMQFPEGTVQHVVRAEAIQWKPCPPNLPSGCEIARMNSKNTNC